MIAADTSSLVAYLSGAAGDDVALIEQALSSGSLRLPPSVVSELLSKPDASQIEPLLDVVSLISLTEGFWVRAGRSRRIVRARGLKAALADCLIAQCCIDAGIPLITRDSDYRHFEQWCGLTLAK